MNGNYMMQTPFVDREEEIRTLQAVWEQTQDREARLVLICGEAGVGKTRLLAELEERAKRERAQVVWGWCVETGGSAYQPWRGVLRELVRHVESADVSLMTFLGPLLATLLPELKERPYMAGLVFPPPLDPKAEQLRLNAAIAQLLRKTNALRPTVIVIEDAHWADEATLELLGFLARTRALGRLLMCVAYCEDEVSPNHHLATLAGKRVERVLLRNLRPQDTADLLQAMLNQEEVASPLLEKVQWATGGNPFFVQELVRSLVEDGKVLRWTRDGWQVDQAALQEVRPPESIRQVVGQRLTHLSEKAREVLGWASVVGSTFWEGVVEEIGQVPREQVQAALREGLEQELVVKREESAFAGEREYMFNSPTLQEASYEGVAPERQQEGHRRAAAWLMARSQEEANEHLGLIAGHLEKAGQVEQAVVYLRQAGEQAAAQFANAEAVDYFSRALDLTPEGEWARRYALLLAREKVYDLQGARDVQSQDLAALQELAEALADDRRQTEVALRQANYADVIGDYSAAIAAVRVAINLAQATQDVSSEAAGYTRWGRILWTFGDPKAAQPHLERAVALAKATGLRRIEADGLCNLGAAFIYQRKHAEAKMHYEQALYIYRELGDRQGESRALSSRGDVPWRLGDYDEARVYFEQALRLSREIGDRLNEGAALANLSLVFRLLGDGETAREYGQQALRIAQEVDDPRWQGYALMFLGHALASLGHLAEAAESYRQAFTLWHKLGQRDLAIESLAGLARLSLTQGDMTQAQAHVEEILSYLETNTLDGTDEPFWIYLTCYRFLRANQDPRAQDILDTAHRLLQEQAAKISDEEMRRSFLENVAAHREIVSEWAKGEQRDGL